MLASGLLFLAQHSFAQKDSSGIYKTAVDFQQRKLSYAINCKAEKHKINPDVLFKDYKVKVRHQGITYTFRKSELYGYRDCDGKEYKFVNNAAYSILNPGESLLIYFYQHLAHAPKNAEQYPPMYFFSKDATSAVRKLTKANLKAAFPDDHRFYDALDANFKEDRELSAYDSFHKMYKLNWLLKNYKN